MTQSSITGRHLFTGRNVSVTCTEGLVTEIADTPLDESPEPALWLAPALFDLQVNGYAGVDFQSDDVQVEGLRRAVHALRQAGCTRFLLTLITDEWHALTKRFRRLKELRASDPELRVAIAGWHVEGPFLSSEPGFCGTHNRSVMLDPTPDKVRELLEIGRGEPLLLTIAPERDGAVRAIELAVSEGCRVSLGHTNASADRLREAVGAGATMFTHLGNGCVADLNRHDNILWRVLDQLEVTATLIPDGIHVTPPLFRILHRALPADRVCYITDAMSAAGAGPGTFKLGPRILQVGADGIVREPGTPYLSGSSLEPLEGVRRATRMLGCPWQECWKRFSTVPATLMGLGNGLTAGEPAHFVRVLEKDGSLTLAAEN